VRTTLLRLATSTEFGARRSIAVLLLILLAVSLSSALHAVAKPFWYDEICTVILCRLPSASEIWHALDNAADGNPPLFYLVARLTRQLVSDDHLGYRLPSILGLLSTVSCIYVILSRRVKHLSALVGATFVLCTSATAYADEARPYALVLGCVSGAILAWQRIDDSWLYSLVVTITLAAAVSLHYYAILVWPAFCLAETSVWIFHRRFRVRAWASLLVGALPLLLFARLLQKLHQYYGPHFWAQTGFKQAFLAYNWLFNVDGYWGWTFAVGITAIFLYFSITNAGIGSSRPRLVEVNVLPIEEQTLTLMLLWLPAIAVIAAKISHSGLTERYMLPTVLGGALAFGYVVDEVHSAARVLLLVLFLMNYALSSAGLVKSVLKGSLLEPRAAATREVKAIGALTHDADLPIVIASGLWYLPMAYYTPADSNARLYAVVDPHTAVTSDVKTDSVDLGLLVLRQYFPLQVEDYAGFVSRHREFLLVLGGPFDWWPARLAEDGYTLSVVSAEQTLVSAGETTIYKVTARP
jgi:hypothetical protein